VQVAAAERPEQAVARFRDLMAGGGLEKTAAHYGLILALSAQGNHQEARQQLHALIASDGERLPYRMVAIAIERAAGDAQLATALARALVAEQPDYYPAQLELATSLTAANQVGEAETVLERLAKDRPTDPQIWFELAETSGLAGDIAGVHRARAEYFALIGVFDKARSHLGYARRLQEQDFRQVAMIDQRLRDLDLLEQQTASLRR